MQKYGQHFLKNKAVLEKIAEATSLENKDVVIEIGPGHGELTEELRSKNSKAKIICIERDPSLIPILTEKFKDDSELEIIEGDALIEIPKLLEKLSGEKVKVVGNIPYYITGFLLRTIGESQVKPETSILMIQKEVAHRLTARPPNMNRLAAMTQVWANIEMLFTVPKGDFDPRPQVDSAVTRLETRDLTKINLQNYFEIAKIAFQQPRKTIINNLSAGLPKLHKSEIASILKTLNLNPEDRPQNLHIENLQKLSSNLDLAK